MLWFYAFQIKAEEHSDDAIEVSEDFLNDILLPALRMLKKNKLFSDAIISEDSNQDPSVC